MVIEHVLSPDDSAEIEDDGARTPVDHESVVVDVWERKVEAQKKNKAKIDAALNKFGGNLFMKNLEAMKDELI
jgi:hypothetical protein